MQPIVNSMMAAIPGLQGLGGAGGAPSLPSPAGGVGEPAPFSDLLSDAVGQVSQLEDTARTTVTGLMSGNGVDVHEAMIATEKASMGFELALAVRNKAVQAYQSVIGMQF
jgi:flagellar hook-basal body complex protein FliE